MTERTYTDPEVFRAAERGESWADPRVHPTQISAEEWAERQARALIPFDVVGGRPVNPFGPTGIRYGRNRLGHWGEQACADAIVIASDGDGDGHRWLLMIRRSDDGTWAVPGGYIDPGEAAHEAATRELMEEANLYVPADLWHVLPSRGVPDPRASDEAWMVTRPCRHDIKITNDLPLVIGGDDATRAAWIRADNFATLAADIVYHHGGDVFTAHFDMLSDILGGE